MITQWNVLARLRQLMASDDEQDSELIPICLMNLERVLSLLDEKSDKDDVRIIQAAAALSYYDYSLRKMSCEDNVTSFKAGDITVSKSKNAIMEIAEKQRAEALAELTPLMKDTQFSFRQIEV